MAFLWDFKQDLLQWNNCNPSLWFIYRVDLSVVYLMPIAAILFDLPNPPLPPWHLPSYWHNPRIAWFVSTHIKSTNHQQLPNFSCYPLPQLLNNLMFSSHQWSAHMHFSDLYNFTSTFTLILLSVLNLTSLHRCQRETDGEIVKPNSCASIGKFLLSCELLLYTWSKSLSEYHICIVSSGCSEYFNADIHLHSLSSQLIGNL